MLMNLELTEAARLPSSEVLTRLGSSESGLTTQEATARLKTYGPNSLGTHGVTAGEVLLRQLRNPLLILLAGAAVISFLVGDRTSASIILAISSLSVGLSFFNEYRSEQVAEELHARIRHKELVLRDGSPSQVDVTALVPGDVVLLDVGDVVPADLRLLEVSALECDEAVVTGESMPVAKTAAVEAQGDSSLDLPSCALMGTVVKAGRGRGVVVRTGRNSTFGHIAAEIKRQPAETAFQAGLRDFSLLLVKVTAALIVPIFLLNWLFGRPLLDSLLFALAIAVGMTPQLLPAVVTVSLSFGASRLASRSVLVKRLISIEDLGNITVLFTDKTGTLTEGAIDFVDSVDAAGKSSPDVLRLGLLCSSAQFDERGEPNGNPLDVALWRAPGAKRELVQGVNRVNEIPFDYERKRATIVLEESGQSWIVSKGAPESVLARCHDVPESAHTWLNAAFDEGRRVVAVASRDLPAGSQDSDDTDLELDGFLVFTDPLKKDAAQSLDRLSRLGVEVKIVTGDNDRVARRLCVDVGLEVNGVLTGADLDRMDDSALSMALASTTIFSRVTPEQKSRVIRLQRSLGSDVGFLGDGVNDAVALHDADVGISVDSATDVAKDAADIVLLDKDLGILGEGILEGRQIFSNTIKYVLMGTSSNFGNMFSAAGASLFLPFLPMTAPQILLNNLLYDTSEMTIPTDRVDEELVRRPAHWDIAFIRRFMVLFGPISSIFDFLTFGVMLLVFRAGAHLFQTGWFVESLATQTLVIFVIRTRQVPFFRSRPGTLLAAASIASVVVGTAIALSPLGSWFGFVPLPWQYFVVVGAMVAVYLALAEAAKAVFYRWTRPATPLSIALAQPGRRVHRLQTYWWGRRKPA
ncbi:MAG TPA: magnesium-translocating P-type ATPase [Candidatus Dormibacteraeota bacterium]|nr:magnesium-translocating P-type ATPase [Candidatus Dormibacteraeota bacterium]